jgi:hypothetical protein
MCVIDYVKNYKKADPQTSFNFTSIRYRPSPLSETQLNACIREFKAQFWILGSVHRLKEQRRDKVKVL